ncbi:GNAT family N-acetyltransferase [Niabella ginsengisoli]|uniref:GNAT family N-acetyltransferase n=1 Tax=Niabella ginsengisoli TaxID=522298 RepID=A0ABS9SJ23_9BACT|nr:GNAT family N-acetyltransferase [Niabella ginsengisoli]MCH5598355.1 GNAT family N-acetyltransferase [Niabella ginsengisoli]
MEIYIRQAFITDLPIIKSLALSIWPETYSSILSAQQIEYMLELFYSNNALTNDFNKTGYHFFIINIDEVDSGYAGVEAKDNYTWHLHKIYLSQKFHGKGLGKVLIRYVENFAKEHGASFLTLNVNRYNKSLHFYKACGYTILKEENIDIGNGFFMNDYVMKKELK